MEAGSILIFTKSEDKTAEYVAERMNRRPDYWDIAKKTISN